MIMIMMRRRTRSTIVSTPSVDTQKSLTSTFRTQLFRLRTKTRKARCGRKGTAGCRRRVPARASNGVPVAGPLGGTPFVRRCGAMGRARRGEKHEGDIPRPSQPRLAGCDGCIISVGDPSSTPIEEKVSSSVLFRRSECPGGLNCLWSASTRYFVHYGTESRITFSQIQVNTRMLTRIYQSRG